MSRRAEANKALVRRYVDEVWNRGDPTAIERYVSADYEFVPPDGTPPLRGPDGLRPHVASLRGALAEFRMQIDDMVAEDDRVAWSWTMTGRHAGPGLGRPSGNAVRVRGVAVYRIVDGWIVERDGEADILGLFQQTGLLPSMEVIAASAA